MAIRFQRKTFALGILFVGSGLAVGFAACADTYTSASPGAGGSMSATSSKAVGTGGAGGFQFDSGPSCDPTCSNDLKSIVDCNGTLVMPCSVDQGCANATCIDDPCKAAELSKSSYGCDYWALKTAQTQAANGACFAAFIANTWGKPVHLQVEYGGNALSVKDFTILASNPKPPFTHYDDIAGLGIGDVAILFLSRNSKNGTVVACPQNMHGVDGETGVPDTGTRQAFHIKSDYPVVAYQMTPYGAATAGVTSATLLLPTSAWDTNYIAINAYKSAEPDGYPGGNPSLDIVAYKDGTQVTILPKADIVGGPGSVSAGIGPVAAAPKNMPAVYTLAKGEFLQITQPEELTGSVIQSTEAVGVFGASACMVVPLGQTDCDSAQQQIPPIRALGSEYVSVRYRGRGGAALVDGGPPQGGQDESVPWRLVGAVDGTTLTWDPAPPSGAPKSINLGETAEFSAPGPFVVKSQDANHPFYLGGYMTGGGTTPDGGAGFNGEGDPDWVNVITPPQYLNHYIFFTDTTYPETDLVLVRTPSKVNGAFADVTLNCAGASPGQKVTGWTKIGGYEYTRVDLVTGNFDSVNGCSNGRQELQSPLPFGVTVWGWGHPAEVTGLASYAYPAGAGFQPINAVVIPPTPK